MAKPEAPLDNIEQLAALHASAYIPYEPYCGVGALFNGDIHSVDPSWAPREHWLVASAYEIEHLPLDQIIAEAPHETD